MLPCCSLLQTYAKAAAKRNIDSVSRGYVHAKRASAELENCTRGLIRGGTSVPLQGTSQEVHQVGHWYSGVSGLGCTVYRHSCTCMLYALCTMYSWRFGNSSWHGRRETQLVLRVIPCSSREASYLCCTKQILLVMTYDLCTDFHLVLCCSALCLWAMPTVLQPLCWDLVWGSTLPSES